MDEQTIQKMIRLQKDFAELYAGELTSVASNYIHIQAEAMDSLRPTHEIKFVNNHATYTGKEEISKWEAQCVIDGVLFIALYKDDAALVRHGFSVPELEGQL